MKLILIDIENTLVEMGQNMEPRFMKWFETWEKGKNVYLVSNNTFNSMYERLGRQVIENAAGIFACSGNHILNGRATIRQEEWRPSFELKQFLENFLTNSKYQFKMKCGPNFENRAGMLNFSICGRTNDLIDRKKYVEYDKTNKELIRLISQINDKFPELFACLGDEISVDIYPKGKDKSQIFKTFEPYVKNNIQVYFYEYTVRLNSPQWSKNLSYMNNNNLISLMGDSIDNFSLVNVHSTEMMFDSLKRT